jgi:hypothetical protein
MHYSGKVEYAEQRKLRARNKPYYRLAHWPIWIWVFFLAPGPLTFSLFARGFHFGNLAWLGAVMVGTAIPGLRGRLPGVEPQPYILRFDEDRPNPLYRRVCYTFAWNAVVSFALLNLAGLLIAVTTGVWRMKQIYTYAYAPLCAAILFLGLIGKLPRVGSSTRGEGHERRYFYGSKLLPRNHTSDLVELAAFVAVLLLMGLLSYQGKLYRTRPILPGEWAVSD